MYALKLYTGKISESLYDAIPEALAIAKRENDTIHLLWNGVLIYVNPDSTCDECIAQYDEEQKKEAIFSRYKCGEFISYNDLGIKLASLIKKL